VTAVGAFVIELVCRQASVLDDEVNDFIFIFLPEFRSSFQ